MLNRLQTVPEASRACLARLSTPVATLMLAVVALMAGCEQDQGPLELADLTPGEHLIVERIVILERAKAAALLNRDAGEAILDSLAIAWGDSALEATKSGAPVDALRAEAFAKLLKRFLAAEQDSLMTIPGQDRLGASLPDLPPMAPETETPEEK